MAQRLYTLILICLSGITITSCIQGKSPVHDRIIQDVFDQNASGLHISAVEKTNAMELAVRNRGGMVSEVKLLRSAKEITQETEEVFGYLDQVTSEMVQAAGGNDGFGKPLNPDHKESVKIVWEDDKLKQVFDNYVDFLNDQDYISYDFEYFAPDGKNEPINRRNKMTFGENYFKGSTLSESLRTIALFRNTIAVYEAEALADLGSKIGV